MEIKLKGTTGVSEMAEEIAKIIESTVERVNDEREEGSPAITGYNVATADVVVKFDVEGISEPQLLTVDHHEGLSEVFTWLVDLDEHTEVSNEEASMYDDWTASKVAGEEKVFAPIESEYDDADIVGYTREEYDHFKKEVYTFKDPDNTDRLVRVYQNGQLVQEYLLKEKVETAGTEEA